MPCHVHDRRMEAYLYFDLPETRARLPPDGRAGRDAPPRRAPTRRRCCRPAGRSIRAPAPRTTPSSGRWPATMSTIPTSTRSRMDRPAMTDLSAFSLDGRTHPGHRRQHRHRPGHCRRGRAGRRRGDRRRPLVDGRDGRARLRPSAARSTPVQCDLADHSAAQAMLDAVWDERGPHRRAGQQCRHHPPRRCGRFHRGRLGRRDGRQPQVAVLPLPGLWPAGACRAGRPRQDRQHRLGAELPGRHPRRVLHRLQARRARHHAAAGQRMGGARASTSTPSRRAISRPTTPRRCAPTRTAAPPSSAASRPAAGASRTTSATRRCSCWRRRPTTCMAPSSGRWRLAGTIGDEHDRDEDFCAAGRGRMDRRRRTATAAAWCCTRTS